MTKRVGKLGAWALPAMVAWAALAPDGLAEEGVALGHALARQWCAACHQVEAGATANDAVPSFLALARDPAVSEGGLKAWLADPHPPMPNPSLSRAEIDALVAYLLSLRGR